MLRQHVKTAAVLLVGALVALAGCQSAPKQQVQTADTTAVTMAQNQTQEPTAAPATGGQSDTKPSTQNLPQGKAAQSKPKPATTQPAATKPAPVLVTVPAGTALKVALQTHLRTDSNQVGDRFTAKTSEEVRINETTVLPTGTEVRGKLTLVEEPHRTAGKAQLTLAFDEVVGPDGKTYALSTTPIVLEGAKEKVSDAGKVGIGAAVGGVIGALASKDKATGAVTGAVVGAVGGGAVALATKGKQLDLPVGQAFSVDLTAPVQVAVPATTAGK
jgi:hypothetical protein